MSERITPRLLLSGLILAIAVALGSVSPVAAVKGGCPSSAAGNGASHANDRSAHGSAKQAERFCQSDDHTTSLDGADIQVVGVTVSAPDNALVGEEFLVLVGASLLNIGPADPVLVDTTFALSTAPNCLVSPAGPVSVEDTSMPVGVSVYISRAWWVTCLDPGSATLTAEVAVAIDSAQSAADPDPSNNTGSGDDTTQID